MAEQSNPDFERLLAWRREDSHRTPGRPIDTGNIEIPERFRADKHQENAAEKDPLDRENNPVDPWRFVEREPEKMPLSLSETLFALSNGYMGMRGNPAEGRGSAVHGTYINGLHETWPIVHAEDAYGLAREGQNIIDAPDAKNLRLYIDDEPFRQSGNEIDEYERSLDFREGVLRKKLLWRTASGKKVRITAERMVSFTEKHVALTSLEVELVEGDAGIVVCSEILNRQDGADEYRDNSGTQTGAAATALDTAQPGSPKDEAGFDPRQTETFAERVLIPTYQAEGDHEGVTLGYRVNHSGMSVAAAIAHHVSVDTGNGFEDVDGESISSATDLSRDHARVTYHFDAQQGSKIRIEKYMSYHSSAFVGASELGFRTAHTLERAQSIGYQRLMQDQKAWLEDFWERSDVTIQGKPELQQAIRWNLFQIIQASARAEKQGIPAKGMTGSGYGGHYFWDTEIYMLPFLSYTNPDYARNALMFRHKMLPDAKLRAEELNHDGVLFPWRTINGKETSAFYAAGTAAYHIDADIAFALMKYFYATGDTEFLVNEGLDILVGTARFWMSLGFFNESRSTFQIHSVTGPDEYTTVVNNNLYTNVMAQFNLRAAAEVFEHIQKRRPEMLDHVKRRYDVTEHELANWADAAKAMRIPFNKELGVNPQDDEFLYRQIWNLDDPDQAPKRPLLLYYHPLTIYRYQILKQADVVLALFLQGQNFDTQTKHNDYLYYDQLTTGDSSLSSVVQSIMAAELGMEDKSMDFFYRGLFIDLADLHGNTSDGAHIASAGGVWSALVNGFGGFRDNAGTFSIDPRLPSGWEELTYILTLEGTQVDVAVRAGEVELVTHTRGETFGPVTVYGQEVTVTDTPQIIKES